MAAITAQIVNELRSRTGAGLMDCKKALVETDGDMDAAAEILRKKGAATRDKKAGRSASQGTVASYIHMGGRIGVLVEVNCESDFVAKNELFQNFARDIAMHIAAAAPRFITREEVPAEEIAKETEIVKAQCEGKPAMAIEKIVAGKLDKYYSEICLLDQPYVKDSTGKTTVNDLITEQITKTGENIKISRFSRFQIGG
ncbi:MAG: translation elongation factor Ts [Opitutales bacterium]|nr:translation elongation factor Ts [Verrucomicrobiota bacterium]MBP3303162.1 translation elongation factor Ts [Opitutales bacterium]MBQ6705082.1 translation elongation factor Ts [Opitutales bacterium]MBQ7331941.1 translation elongation factor Ts [Opitutales bacterium]MBQ8444936.1 translation elongation factor Ts [Opitutales bacterium]